MSRLGKKPIELVDGVTATYSAGILFIKGSKGELKRSIDEKMFDLALGEKAITLSLKPSKENRSAIWGTIASHINNMIEGVSKGFEKKLSIEGIGYKGEVKGNTIVFALGFSHPVVVNIPEGLKAVFEKNNLTISGIDKEEVGAFAANIRDYKRPEPYKGKGIRYQGEVVVIKQGKKSV